MNFSRWKRRNNKKKKEDRKAIKKMWWSKKRGLLENKVLNLQPNFFPSLYIRAKGMADTLLQQHLILKISVVKGNQTFLENNFRHHEADTVVPDVNKEIRVAMSLQHFSQNIKPACSLPQFPLCLLLKIVKQLPLSLSFPHLLTCRLFLSSPLLHRDLTLLPTEIPTPLSSRRRPLPTTFLKYFSLQFFWVIPQPLPLQEEKWWMAKQTLL